MMMAMGAGAGQAYWLTQGMARAVGVNLTASVLEGWMTRGDLSAMVARCQFCGREAECTKWLARHGAGAAALPDYCANKAELEALRGG